MPKPERAGDRGEGKPVRTGRDRPIIFSGPMVKALLAGAKTQTRRVLKPQPAEWHAQVIDITKPFFCEEERGWGQIRTDWGRNILGDLEPEREVWVPLSGLRFAVGDRLWAREAWRTSGDGGRADYLAPSKLQPHPVWYEANGTAPADDLVGKLRPSIFMPRWASRLTLIVEAVKVERLWDISEVDAIDEGALRFDLPTEGPPTDRGKPPLGQSPKVRFAALWRSIHGPDAWNANPWVAAITFRVIPQNIDSLDPTPIRDTPTDQAGDDRRVG